DFPFTGIGLNTFPIILDTLYPLFSVGPDAQVPHAHNLFLQTAVDLGVIGFVSLVALLIAAAVALVKAWKRLPAERYFGTGIGLGLLAHVIYSLTDAVALGAKPGVFLWAMLGAAISLSAGKAEAPSGWQWAQWALFGLACGLAIFVSLSGLRMFPI